MPDIRELSENPSDVQADVGIRAPTCATALS